MGLLDKATQNIVENENNRGNNGANYHVKMNSISKFRKGSAAPEQLIPTEGVEIYEGPRSRRVVDNDKMN